MWIIGSKIKVVDSEIALTSKDDSNIKVNKAIFLLPVLSTLVAPIFPDPIFLTSFFKKNLVNIKPKGIDPVRYEHKHKIIISIFKY